MEHGMAERETVEREFFLKKFTQERASLRNSGIWYEFSNNLVQSAIYRRLIFRNCKFQRFFLV